MAYNKNFTKGKEQVSIIEVQTNITCKLVVAKGGKSIVTLRSKGKK